MKNISLKTWLLGTTFLFAILFLNWTFSYCSDDCFYALKRTATQGLIPMHLETLSNAWLENWRDGHRPVVHLFVRIFTGCFDKWAFNLANTCMMGAFLICIIRLARKDLSTEFNSLSWLLTLVFFILCKGEAYLWCAGSINYLWAGTGTLLFCLVIARMERKEDPWWMVATYSVVALFAGWLQEAFVLPLGCALVAYRLINYKTISTKKVIVLFFYLIGIFLLVRIAGRRASTIPPFSLMTLCLTLLKVAVAIKGVWLLLAVFLMSKGKRDFIARNLFFLLIVGASISMISIIGFNGERSLWAANLFSIVILFRETTPPKHIAYCLTGFLVITLGICCCLGYKIKNEFKDFTASYLASENGLCSHNRVNCGPFARFFHQSIYTWADGLHGKCYGYFYGRDIAPVALQKEDYCSMLSGTYCSVTNRIPINTEAYTTPTSNTIIIPWDDSKPRPTSVTVCYDFPNGLVPKVERELAAIKNPRVESGNTPREICINKKRFLLVSKEPGGDSFIREITFDN